MSKKGFADLPLHGGKAPKWLFKRMLLLSKGIIETISYEYGVDEILKRVSDPYWFQALACTLGYDWHSSGTTTVTCGALKEAVNPENHGFSMVGGKGKASKKTLHDVERIGELFNLSSKKIQRLKYCSRMAAKIDNTAVQDGYNLYHHVFIFSESGKWAVIQQGLNSINCYARRYHWLSDNIDSFVCEPQNAIIADKRHHRVLDMTAKLSKSNQKISVDLVNDNPHHLIQDWAMLSKPIYQRTLDNWKNVEIKNHSIKYLNMPRSINWKKMKEIYDFQPKNYEQLLSLKGVGPNTIRALALISEIIYGEKPSWSDPVKFSFTVGGKDGVPYPVDRNAMDESTEIIRQGIKQAKIGNKERIYALKRLKDIIPKNS
jgi:hypothetical protein